MTLSTKKRIDYYLGGLLLAILKPCVYLTGLLLRRDHELKPRGRIVVQKMLGGGSLVLAFPSLLGIKKQYPECGLYLVTTPSVKPFAEILGIFDEIWVIDDRTLTAFLKSALFTYAEMFRSDTVLDLEVYSRLSAVLNSISLARNRIGFYLESVFWRQNLYTHLIYFNRYSCVQVFYEKLARTLGAEPASQEECFEFLVKTLSLTKSPSQIQRICVGIACSDNGRERMMRPSEWLQFAKTRAPEESKYELHLLGGPSDWGDAEKTKHDLQSLGSKVLNHCGQKSLKESIELLFQADEYWGIDSALLHLARILKIPNRSVWGPTDPATRLTPHPLTLEIIYKKTPCSPCIHVTETPPCAGNNVCVQRHFGFEQELRARNFVPDFN